MIIDHMKFGSKGYEKESFREPIRILEEKVDPNGNRESINTAIDKDIVKKCKLLLKKYKGIIYQVKELFKRSYQRKVPYSDPSMFTLYSITLCYKGLSDAVNKCKHGHNYVNSSKCFCTELLTIMISLRIVRTKTGKYQLRFI